MKIFLVVDIWTDWPLKDLGFRAGLLENHLLEYLGHGSPVGLYGADALGSMHIAALYGRRADATQRLKRIH